jgi:hypothetical protein
MNANAEAQLFACSVSDLKASYPFEKMQGHGCNLSGMSVTIPYR